jgi:hypothetical protein
MHVICQIRRNDSAAHQGKLRLVRSNGDVTQLSPLALRSPRPSLASLDDISDRESRHSIVPAARLSAFRTVCQSESVEFPRKFVN